MQDFHKLDVWRKGHALVLAVYRRTGTFPRDEKYGITSQLRRAAASIPMNIAEGCGRKGPGDFSRFLQIAMGSATELEYSLLLARDLDLLDPTEYAELQADAIEVKRMLAAMIRTIESQRTQSLARTGISDI